MSANVRWIKDAFISLTAIIGRTLGRGWNGPRLDRRINKDSHYVEPKGQPSRGSESVSSNKYTIKDDIGYATPQRRISSAALLRNPLVGMHELDVINDVDKVRPRSQSRT